ncbi:hypothetical protein BP6252_10055 [Coleophoma cylindrospora]|uniref:Rhodopsin domain-containing protein n=1 Tax=Coleophoma cylindrospora TaxID=1849047 RepID=A0A3D8QXJ9_9HELO|nr:hypothetical protein BP6252_10055 [Coleophoma cylindrospora]
MSKVQADICHFEPSDVSRLILALTFTSLFTTSLVVILRLLSKAVNRSEFKADDFILVAALILSLPAVTSAIKLYIGEIFYVIVLGLTKFSILFLYIQIFAAYVRFRYFAICLGIYIIVGTSVISLLTIFQCKPLAYFWDRDLHGTCMSIGGVAYANSAFSITSDVFLIALPMPILINLNMGLRRKIEVALILSLGSFGCVVSMVRLKALRTAHFGISTDTTHDYILPVIWTALELAVAMSCACLPAIRNLWSRLCARKKASIVCDPTPDTSGASIPRPRIKPWAAASTIMDDDITTLITQSPPSYELDQRVHQPHRHGEHEAPPQTYTSSSQMTWSSAEGSEVGNIQGNWPITSTPRKGSSSKGESEIYIFPGII